MTIGVATVLTMIALGTGAEAAIEQQVRAAGMNLIVVTAGNYKTKTEDDGGGVVDHQARIERSVTRSAAFRRPSRSGEAGHGRAALSAIVRAISHQPVATMSSSPAFHPEDDPMEKHDHPTSRQRLGDVEAGLGAAATLTPADADAIRQHPRRAVRVRRDSRERPRRRRRQALVHPAPRRRRRAAVDPPVVDVHGRTVLHGARAVAPRAGRRARRLRRREAVRQRQPGRPADSAVEAAVPGRRRHRQRQLDGRAIGRRRSVRRGLRAVHDHPQAPEPVEAERHHASPPPPPAK